MTELNLKKLREISKKCSANKKTQEYVGSVCFQIKDLLVNYARDKNINEKKILDKYFGHDAAPKNFSSGQVPTKYINDVIDNGNIREQMTLIMNFGMSGCAVILWAIEKKRCLSKASIELLQDRLYNLTGMRDIKKINKYIKGCEKNGCILPCKFISLTLDGSVSASRMSAYPIIDTLRKPRIKTEDKYLVNVQHVYPKLSQYELEYIKINSNYEIKNNILPWISGLQYWEVNRDSFYIRLMEKNKQMVVTGPSGNTDLNLSIFRLFDNFDINLAIFACIAHMCSSPDHSPCEILIASIPYGLNDWTIDKDSFKYVHNKLKLYI
jgi:hypothetical protein